MAFFVLAASFTALAGGIFETSSNNYYAEIMDIEEQARGDLELPREFPGFAVAALAGAVFFVSEVHLGMIATGMVALGLVGLTAFAMDSSSYGSMLAFLIIWSTGTHLMMPVRDSLALALAERGNEGRRLGLFGAANSVATIAGCALVWFIFRRHSGSDATTPYRMCFILAAGVAAMAFMAFLKLRGHMPAIHTGHRPRIVFRRRYGLFYLLCVLFGARKQVFITFGPWVIIKVYGQPADTIAALWLVSTILGVFVAPFVGRMIDRFGERRVLMGDGLLLLLVCLAYGFAGDLFQPLVARFICYGAFVLDLTLLAAQMARTTYLSKLAHDRREVGATLGLGVSINHAVSIPIAMAGGRIWDAYGSHRPVFLGAAVVAVLIVVASSAVRLPPSPSRSM